MKTCLKSWAKSFILGGLGETRFLLTGWFRRPGGEQEGVEVVKRAEVQFPQAAAQRLTLDHTERCQSSFPSQSLHWSRVNLKINAPSDNAQGLRRGGNAVMCYPTDYFFKKSPGNRDYWINGQNLTWGHLLEYGLLWKDGTFATRSKNTTKWQHLLAQRNRKVLGVTQAVAKPRVGWN